MNEATASQKGRIKALWLRRPLWLIKQWLNAVVLASKWLIAISYLFVMSCLGRFLFWPANVWNMTPEMNIQNSEIVFWILNYWVTTQEWHFFAISRSFLHSFIWFFWFYSLLFWNWKEWSFFQSLFESRLRHYAIVVPVFDFFVLNSFHRICQTSSFRTRERIH